jgi:hypothetical protein
MFNNGEKLKNKEKEALRGSQRSWGRLAKVSARKLFHKWFSLQTRYIMSPHLGNHGFYVSAAQVIMPPRSGHHNSAPYGHVFTIRSSCLRTVVKKKTVVITINFSNRYWSCHPISTLPLRCICTPINLPSSNIASRTRVLTSPHCFWPSVNHVSELR